MIQKTSAQIGETIYLYAELCRHSTSSDRSSPTILIICRDAIIDPAYSAGADDRQTLGRILCPDHLADRSRRRTTADLRPHKNHRSTFHSFQTQSFSFWIQLCRRQKSPNFHRRSLPQASPLLPSICATFWLLRLSAHLGLPRHRLCHLDSSICFRHKFQYFATSFCRKYKRQLVVSDLSCLSSFFFVLVIKYYTLV